MKTFKRLIGSILIIVVAMGLGSAIYFIKQAISKESVPLATVAPVITAVPTEQATDVPELKQYIITTDTVNIRTAPTTESDVIVKVPKDTVLQLLYSDSEWSSIMYEGQNAYINNEFVESYNGTIE